MRAFFLDGEEIAIYHVAGEEFYATSNVCSHAFALLSEGSLDGRTVTCPKHGGKFDVPSGAPLEMPAVTRIETYPVTLEDGDLFVEIEE